MIIHDHLINYFRILVVVMEGLPEQLSLSKDILPSWKRQTAWSPKAVWNFLLSMFACHLVSQKTYSRYSSQTVQSFLTAMKTQQPLHMVTYIAPEKWMAAVLVKQWTIKTSTSQGNIPIWLPYHSTSCYHNKN